MEAEERLALRRRVGESAAGTTNTIALLALGSLLQLVLLASVYYLIQHDITERRRVAAELKLRGELLEAANKELEAFSYSVSHDLRAPLRHIDGYAALLTKAVGDSLNDKARRYLQTISASAKQMGQLIDDLLVFSRMGRQEMLLTTVNLDQLIKAILYDLRLDLQGREISWTIDTLPEVPGDPAMLRQVFVNLIDNALRHGAVDRAVHVRITAHREGGDVHIVIADDGDGVNDELRDQIFRPYVRGATAGSGAGLGLALTRGIVDAHHGRIWIDDHPRPAGTVFHIVLPIEPADAPHGEDLHG